MQEDAVLRRACAVIMMGGVVLGAGASGSSRALGAQRSPASPVQSNALASGSADAHRALLSRYCVTCHNTRLKTGGLELDSVDVSDVAAHAELWERVVRKLRGGVMPPAGAPRPDSASYDGLIVWLEDQLDRAAAVQPNPGRTETLHRLNRAEYQNAVRDLFALDIDMRDLLPADDASYGFDNMAGVLRLNHSLLERYLSAAIVVTRTAIGSAASAPLVERFAVPVDRSQYEQVEGLPFGTRGGTLIRHRFPRNGEYEIKVELMCTTEVDLQCNGSVGFAQPHELLALVDNELVASWTLVPRELNMDSPNEVRSDPFDPDERWTVRVPIKAGLRDVGVTFVKGPSVEYVTEGYRARLARPFRYYADQLPVAMPFVGNVQISGPLGGSTVEEALPSRRAIFTCRPRDADAEAGCAESILRRLGRRAYRRPLTEGEVRDLLSFFTQGRQEEDGTFDSGIDLALRRMLTSPKFLFRIEQEPANVAAGSTYRISDLELASRLSFFLWSSIPDEELLELATRGRLRARGVLDAQVRRMLADARSHALIENFFGQWLKLRHLETHQPSSEYFPNFNGNLRDAFRRETELFVDHILRADRSVVELLDADYTFANEQLARHYGIPNVTGSQFRLVTYPDARRRGLLGQGSILMGTSHAIRTSPVFRGKWVLENVLGTPPPAPPANVPALSEPELGSKRVHTMRERMAAHRSNPVCSSCHSMIDPAGFALENFDAIGTWRDVDERFQPIDASGVLPDGSRFTTVTDFRAALLAHPERFVANLTRKMLGYALGRGVEYFDEPAVRGIAAAVAQQDYRFSSLVLGIVNSLPFQMRQAEAKSTVVASRRAVRQP
jgi:hypothetical protein